MKLFTFKLLTICEIILLLWMVCLFVSQFIQFCQGKFVFLKSFISVNFQHIERFTLDCEIMTNVSNVTKNFSYCNVKKNLRFAISKDSRVIFMLKVHFLLNFVTREISTTNAHNRSATLPVSTCLKNNIQSFLKLMQHLPHHPLSFILILLISHYIIICFDQK